MIKYIYLILIILKFSSATIACSSLEYKSFSKAIKESEFVALVKIERFYDDMASKNNPPKAMDVKILYLYKGEEKKKIIKVLGGCGADCRVNLTRLKNEKYLLLALTKSSEKENNEYLLYEAGEYFVKFTIWMYCIYLVLSIIVLYVIYRIIKRIRKRQLASIIILFFSLNSFCQLPNYQAGLYKLSKKKVIKLKTTEQVVKINSNGYVIYLDKKTFNSYLPIQSDSTTTSNDTIDLSSYYNVPKNKGPIEQAIYKTAAAGKILVKHSNGNAITEKIYTCEFEEKEKTGCVQSGKCIYIKKSKTILLLETTRLTMIVKFLD